MSVSATVKYQTIPAIGDKDLSDRYLVWLRLHIRA